MTDGDLSNVNANLLNKLKATSAEEWKEERRKAFLARKTGANSNSKAFAFLPKDYTEADEGTSLATVNAKPGATPANEKNNLDFLKSVAGSSNAITNKRPRDDELAAPMSNQPVSDKGQTGGLTSTSVVGEAVGGGSNLKAAILAKLKAKREAEEAAQK